MEYRIGDFSVVSRLSAKTLRYYHEIGILVPSRVEAETGYRWYDESSLRTARTIAKLREWDFSIEGIARILEGGETDEALLERELSIRARQIASEVRRSRQRLHEIEAFRTTLGRVEASPSVVEFVETSPVGYVGLRFRGRYSDGGSRWEELFRTFGAYAAGAPFALYWDREYRDDDAEIEACLPVKKAVSAPPGSSAEFRTLAPARKFRTWHKGPYETLSCAYERLFAELDRREAPWKLPILERYHKGPGGIFGRKPSQYVTEIEIEPASDRPDRVRSS